MGIRKTQVYGLNEAAKALLYDEGEVWEESGVRHYESGREESFSRQGRSSRVKVEECGEFLGMFDESYPLHRYTLPDGRIFSEAEYASPWASGPCIFLALVEEGQKEWSPGAEKAYADYGSGKPRSWVRETLWKDKEIGEAI